MLSLEHKNDYFYLTCNRGKSQGGMKIYADFTSEEKAENVERKRPYSSAFSAIQSGEKTGEFRQKKPRSREVYYEQNSSPAQPWL